MADQCFIGDGNAGVANAGPLPRVGGVTSQAGVAWIRRRGRAPSALENIWQAAVQNRPPAGRISCM